MDEWLSEQLTEIGEVVLSDGWNYWWGRCTTGQLIIADGVLQRIAEKILTASGGEWDWLAQ